MCPKRRCSKKNVAEKGDRAGHGAWFRMVGLAFVLEAITFGALELESMAPGDPNRRWIGYRKLNAKKLKFQHLGSNLVGQVKNAN